jgi:isochorismate synthase
VILVCFFVFLLQSILPYPMSDDFSALDSLIASERSFAVYRLPDAQPVLLVQGAGEPELFDSVAELNGRSGFVMAPFQTNAQHPVVLIQPDVTLKGKKSILQYLKGLPKGTKKTNEAVLTASEHLNQNNEGFLQYKAAFELFQKALHAGSCEKIVLSRTLQLPIPAAFSAGKLFGTACEAYPDAFVYLCHTPMTGTWFGSTPELLLSGEHGNWQTVALAGTRRIKESESNWNTQVDGRSKADWDPKNIREQQVVTSYLEKQLRIKNLIGSISEPYTVRAGQLMHIKTDFRFQMAEQGRVGDLLDFLHPTPAVCGYPKTDACRLILAHEGYDRSYYSGFAGPLNREEKTDLYVNLRCARMSGQDLVLYAGGGLMPDSELKSEWEETEVKLQTLLSLIVIS